MVQAKVITAQIGDEDGLNIGILADEILPNDIVTAMGPPDGDGTDEWVFGSQTFNLLYDISGIRSIKSAYLEVFTGGQGYLGISSLYIDDLFVGQLTDGDIGTTDNNIARLDIFDLALFSSALDGDTNFSIQTNINDGWALDYMRLKMIVSPVPIPAAVWLFGTALIGLVGFSKRRKTT